jgi:hypothetical protein
MANVNHRLTTMAVVALKWIEGRWIASEAIEEDGATSWRNLLTVVAADQPPAG